MKQPPYSLSEAQNILRSYARIKGFSFCNGDKRVVESVIVAPHDKNSRNRFLMLYLLLNNAEEALTMDYNGSDYDVLVMTSAEEGGDGMHHESLFHWLHACASREEVNDVLSQSGATKKGSLAG